MNKIDMKIAACPYCEVLDSMMRGEDIDFDAVIARFNLESHEIRNIGGNKK